MNGTIVIMTLTENALNMKRSNIKYYDINSEACTIDGIIKELKETEQSLINQHHNVKFEHVKINYEGCLEFAYTYELSEEEREEERLWDIEWKQKLIKEKEADIARLEKELGCLISAR